MRKIGWIISSILVSAVAARADFIGTVNKGNEAYHKKDYKSALDMYHTAETDRPESPELKYNIAGAMYQLGDYQEAIKQYEGALKSSDVGLQAQTYYNMGNTYFMTKDYQSAITAYEEALKLNPTDMDAKRSLEVARKKLKEQLSAQPQDGNKQKNQQQEQQQKQQQEGQGLPDQQGEKQRKDPFGRQNQQDKQGKNQQKGEQQQVVQKDGKRMSKEDAERILNAMRDDEQDIQKKVRREQVQGDYGGKDW